MGLQVILFLRRLRLQLGPPEVADRIAAHTRTSFYTALRLIRSKIGLVLAKTNAKIILSAYPIVRMDKHHVAQHEASLFERTKMYQITVDASLRRPQLQTETPKK